MIGILFLLLILFIPSPGAFERIPQSPLATGSGFSFFLPVGSPTDFLSHPAVLSRVQKGEFSTFHSSPFRLAALTQNGITLAVPFKTGVLGAGFASLGQSRYRETVGAVGTGVRIGPNFEAGILLNFFELHISGYGSDRTFGLTVSTSSTFLEGVRWSLLYRNLNRPRLGPAREILPQVIATGVTFSPVPYTTSTLEFEKDLTWGNRYKFGLRWQPLSRITTSTGFATHPTQYTAAVAVQIPRVNPSYEVSLGYGLAFHPELPISQVVSLQLGLR